MEPGIPSWRPEKIFTYFIAIRVPDSDPLPKKPVSGYEFSDNGFRMTDFDIYGTGTLFAYHV